MYLKRVREANTCGCKIKEQAAIRQLCSQVQLCSEILEAICRPPLEPRLVGKFYLSQLIEDVRHKHLIKQTEFRQQNHSPPK